MKYSRTHACTRARTHAHRNTPAHTHIHTHTRFDSKAQCFGAAVIVASASIYKWFSCKMWTLTRRLNSDQVLSQVFVVARLFFCSLYTLLYKASVCAHYFIHLCCNWVKCKNIQAFSQSTLFIGILNLQKWTMKQANINSLSILKRLKNTSLDPRCCTMSSERVLHMKETMNGISVLMDVQVR